MRKHYRKTLVAAAVVGAMALGGSGTASAFEYAMSHVRINDFVISPVPPSLPGSNFVVGSFTFNLTNTAQLSGNPDVIQSATCFGVIGFNSCGVAPVLDAAAAEIPVGVRGGQNNFAFVGPGVSSYASSDSIIYTAQLVTASPTSVESIAEVNVGLNGAAAGNAEIQSNTSVNTVLLGAAGSFALAFTADPDMRAAINSLPGVHSAQSNLSADFTFTSNSDDTKFISWSPQGTPGNDCVVSAALAVLGVTCTEFADSQDLNRNLGTGLNPSDIEHSHEAGLVLTPFGILVSGLPIDDYSLALSTLTSANVVSLVQVPEPESVALVALGLLGMAVGLRRRNRKA